MFRLRLSRRLLAGAAVLSLSATPALAAKYVLTDLGDLSGGLGSQANAIDGQGRVYGFSILGGTLRAFVWTPTDGMQALGGPGGAPLWSVNASNDAGFVAGYHRPIGTQAAVGTVSGGFISLPSGGGSLNFSQANAVNNNGLVVGEGSNGGSTVAFAWTSAGGTRQLNPAGTGTSRAYGVNDAGLVVGGKTVGSFTRAFIFDTVNGTAFQNIGSLPTGASGDSWALDVNNSGQVIGYGAYGASRRGFLWTATSGFTVLGDLAGGDDYSAAIAVNDLGQVVGNSGAAGGRRAFLWTADGGMQDLNGLVDNAGGFVMWEARAISNAGHIAGYGYDANGAQRAFLLTPSSLVGGAVPEPGTWALMIGGFGAVGAALRRRAQTAQA